MSLFYIASLYNGKMGRRNRFLFSVESIRCYNCMKALKCYLNMILLIFEYDYFGLFSNFDIRTCRKTECAISSVGQLGGSWTRTTVIKSADH